MNPKITKVTPQDGFELLLVYETGERRRYDAKPCIYGSWMGELADPGYFSQVGLLMDGWSVCWPNGQDIDPCVLYRESVAV
nr:DUF2442 domain-containing protein [Adlercreutzia sp. ZJ473]